MEECSQSLPRLQCRAYDSRLLPARTCRLQSQEPIEREGSTAAGEEEEEDRSPGQMVGPGVGINERLDNSEHAQERQCGQACGQTEHEQDRTSELERHGQHRSDLRGQHRNLVLICKELDREHPVGGLGETTLQKDRGDGEAEQELDERQRQAPQKVVTMARRARNPAGTAVEAL